MNTKIITLINQIKPILDEALFLNGRTKNWNNQMSLLGNVPELDSIAVMNVISALEAHFGVYFEDEDINMEVFATIESLANLVYDKTNNLIEMAK